MSTITLSRNASPEIQQVRAELHVDFVTNAVLALRTNKTVQILIETRLSKQASQLSLKSREILSSLPGSLSPLDQVETDLNFDAAIEEIEIRLRDLGTLEKVSICYRDAMYGMDWESSEAPFKGYGLHFIKHKDEKSKTPIQKPERTVTAIMEKPENVLLQVLLEKSTLPELEDFDKTLTRLGSLHLQQKDKDQDTTK
jgi:hypothetical protein